MATATATTTQTAELILLPTDMIRVEISNQEKLSEPETTWKSDSLTITWSDEDEIMYAKHTFSNDTESGHILVELPELEEITENLYSDSFVLYTIDIDEETSSFQYETKHDIYLTKEGMKKMRKFLKKAEKKFYNE
jgi:hypothetical protein